jgi:hypothetical protein
MNWVRRVSTQMRECANCDDQIFAGSTFFLVLTEDGPERYCQDCEPDSEDPMC